MVLILFFALAAFLQGSAATTYNVGDSNGWAIPSDSSTYDTWAAGKNFVVGDVLVFNFPTGAHDVAEVTKSGYDGCNSNNPISLENTGPASITLTSSGQKYYICTFGSHCSFGQKLAITVASSTPSSPPPKSATPPPMASTPPPTMAASPPQASPPPMASTPQPASPPPKASSPAPQISPPTDSTPAPAVVPRASTPVPAMGPSPPPKFQAPAPTPSLAASPRSSATPPTSTGASSPTSVPSTQSTDAIPPSSASSLGVTSLFTAFLITTTAMMIQ